MALIPEARPDNDFLGFCRGAYNLQNGDREAALQKAKEGGAYSRSGSSTKHANAYYQKCREQKCAFRSNLVSADPNLLCIKVITFPERGMKLRWTFLAKSHVPQRAVMHNMFAYKCIFCVYQNAPEPAVYAGMDAYLDHIDSAHRGQELHAVVQYKTRCVSNRIADDQEPFDINLWPPNDSENSKVSEWLSDEYLDRNIRPRQGTMDSKRSYQRSNAKPADADEESDEDEGRERIANQSSSRADQLLAPPPQFRHIHPALNPLVSQQTGTSAWDDADANPWAESSSPHAAFVYQPLRTEFRNQNIAHDGEQWPERSNEVYAPEIPPRSELRPPETVRQMQQAFSRSSLSSAVDESVTACLNDIIQIYADALVILNDLAQQAAQSLRLPPSPLLSFAVGDAPPEIEKLRQRGLALFGPSFDIADDGAVAHLQRTSRQLYSGLFRPLGQAARDVTFNDYASILQVAEYSQQTTVAFLKHRLATFNATGGPRPISPQRSPHSLQPPVIARSGYSPTHSRASSQDVPRLSHFSDDSQSGAESERQPSTASTGSHQPPNQPAVPDGRRRSSMLGFLKHGVRGSSDQVKAESGKSGMTKLDFRHRKHSEGTKQGMSKAVELDSTPVVPR
ncbi:hypothetical protein CERZMDRAFT_99784 [Cercospora zeae-maydis SCOH1-5]|uniref:Uncharacterized protein n=1 Tax=Cercospora zeae-maydis SCOH1-5 TaxID=717836 RepID=A0A6A6F9L6_9PEZI|nr:hypothetical protein CERZMDRAFT_99784 [Cercospora zeae-maydis SCOH1-5]